MKGGVAIDIVHGNPLTISDMSARRALPGRPSQCKDQGRCYKTIFGGLAQCQTLQNNYARSNSKRSRTDWFATVFGTFLYATVYWQR
jgi:hypothetical protein